MKRLNQKNIYYIITGAPKAKFAPRIIKEMIKEGARVFTIPTHSGLDFINVGLLKNIDGNILKTEWGQKTNYQKKMQF